MKQDIIDNLRTRAEIRRKIPRAKEGGVDRIADMCEEAADEIVRLRIEVNEMKDFCFNSIKHILSK